MKFIRWFFTSTIYVEFTPLEAAVGFFFFTVGAAAVFAYAFGG